MERGGLSKTQIEQVRRSLSDISAGASASRFTAALTEVVTFMDRVHAPGGPMEQFSLKWRAGRSNVDHLPGIHERVQRCVSSAEEVSTAIEDLEEERIELEDQKPEVRALLAEMRSLLREVTPKCISVSLIFAVAGWMTRQYWLMAVGIFPLFPLIRGASGVLKLHAYLARVDHGLEAVNAELKTTRALEVERHQFESLLNQNLEMFRITISKSLDALESEAKVLATADAGV